MRRLIFIAPLFFSSVASAEDYRALLDEAIDNIYWQYWDDWAYTETSLREEEIWVGRYDPRLDDEERWTLLSVDGREPTGQQSREYHREQNHSRHGADEDSNGITGIVEADTMELVEETDDYWLFTFLPTEEEEAFLQNVAAHIKIMKDGRYVESVDVRNDEDIKPGFGTTINEFVTHLTFGPAVPEGPIVPYTVNVRVKGRVLLFIGFNETEVVRRTDFQYAGD